MPTTPDARPDDCPDDSGFAALARHLSPLAVRFEDHVWPQRPDRGPYQAAITRDLTDLPGQHFGLDLKTLARADQATTAMTRLDVEMSQLAHAGESWAGISALGRLLAHVDAVASSRMEGYTADTLDVVLARRRPGKDAAAAALIATNIQATIDATGGLGLADEDILAVHGILLDGREHDRPGQWRTDQVWIGSFLSTPHTAAFVPPHPDRVPGAIADWSAFTDRTDIPALAHVAIAHAQFETIHPFGDGNGRVGRALVHSMMRATQITTSGFIPISAGLAEDKRRYVDALIAFRDGDANPIVEAFADAATSATDIASALVDDVTDVMDRWLATTSARAGSAALALLPVLVADKSLTSASARQRAGVSQPAADAALHRLEDDGILSRPGTQRRNKVWVAHDIIDIIDTYVVPAPGRTGT